MDKSKSSKRKIIIDTDPGLDDVYVLNYLSACKDIEILAITLVAGNAQMSLISDTTKRVMSFLDKESIPIYEMGSYNLMGKYVKTDGYFGENGFANIQLPESKIEIQKDLVSPTALIHYAKQFPGQVDMIFIGPLTNLALAFLLDNTFPSYVGSITVMGGDSMETTFKNVSLHAEFNCWVDPLAFRIVSNAFSSLSNPILLIDWCLCWNSLLNTTSLFKGLLGELGENRKANKHIELVYVMSDDSNDIIKRNFWEGGFLTADLFSAIALHNPSIIKSKKRVRITDVAIEGEKIGHTTFEDDLNGPFELVTKIDTDKMIEDFNRVLSGACED